VARRAPAERTHGAAAHHAHADDTANIGKGLLALLTGTGDGEFEARVLSYVAIYSAHDLRDDALQAQLTASMLRAPRASFTHLTRRPHGRSDACFLHADEWCLRRS
jgi:hypothetical protein